MNRVGDTLLHLAANEEIVRAFNQYDVDFILIGGLAISWHCTQRKADDMDLLVNPSEENSMRIARALTNIGLNGFRDNSFVTLGLQAPLKQKHYAEILTPRKGGLSYSEVASDAVAGKVFGMPIKLASILSLLKMKQEAVASGSEQLQKHQADIVLLRNNDI